MNINLHIERLVLEGIPLAGDDVRRVQAAIEAELTKLVAGSGDGGAGLAGRDVEYVRGSDIRMAADEDPGVGGQNIAGALYGGIVR